MVDIKPFEGIRYTKKAGNMDNLIAQPYDKIDSKMQDDYYKLSEYNICRLTLPKESNRYEIANNRLHSWLDEDIMKRDKPAGFYVYYVEFNVNGERLTRKGFIGALRLHPFEENIVLPHEKTHKEPKIDRLNMLKKTKHTLEPGFILYSDPKMLTITIFDEITKDKPIIETKDDFGYIHKIWKLEDKEKIKQIQTVFANQQLVIADGHHRYETACTYRDMRREEAQQWNKDDAFNFRMIYLVPIEDHGLKVLATHRLLAKVKVEEKHVEEFKKYFEIKEITKKEIPEFLKKHEDMHAFVYYQDGKAMSLLLKKSPEELPFLPETTSKEYKNLNVVILRDLIFKGIMDLKDLHIDEDIFYIRFWNEAVKKIDSDDLQVAFLLNSTKAEEVLSVAKNHEKMPQKSTDFFPKMISGLTLMSLEEGEKLN